MHTASMRVLSLKVSHCEEQRGKHTQCKSENTRQPGESEVENK